MLESIYSEVSTQGTAFELEGFLICSGVSLLLGLAIAYIYRFRNPASKNFMVTLALLPGMVQMVISLVNGNIGAGVAVMGVFNLVRFRSVPGSAKDIGSVFFAMAVGLACGMGYVALAALFTLIVGVANIVFMASPIGTHRGPSLEKSLRITIPEELDYTGMFDDIFERYTTRSECVQTKTTNMGSLFQVEYEIQLKDAKQEKRFIDELRVRNGNLPIVCGRLGERVEL